MAAEFKGDNLFVVYPYSLTEPPCLVTTARRKGRELQKPDAKTL